MTYKDTFNKDREVFKNGTLKEKIQFFADYYLLYTVIALVVLGSLVSWIFSLVTEKEVALTGFFLNCVTTSAQRPYTELMDDFLESVNLDPEKYQVELNTVQTYVPSDPSADMDNYNTVQLIGSYIVEHELDFIVADRDALTEYAYLDSFEDLSLVLTEEQMQKLEYRLLYVDRVVVDALIAGNYPSSFPDCTKPETMENPVPVLIDMQGCDVLTEGYAGLQIPLVFGAAANTQHPELVSALIDYLFNA